MSIFAGRAHYLSILGVLPAFYSLLLFLWNIPNHRNIFGPFCDFVPLFCCATVFLVLLAYVLSLIQLILPQMGILFHRLYLYVNSVPLSVCMRFTSNGNHFKNFLRNITEFSGVCSSNIYKYLIRVHSSIAVHWYNVFPWSFTFSMF